MNQTTGTTSVFKQLIDPLGECLTPEVARRIADLRASAEVQARLDLLGDKCTEGHLTEEEKEEYETCVQLIDFISILQAKARKILAEVASR